MPEAIANGFLKTCRQTSSNCLSLNTNNEYKKIPANKRKNKKNQFLILQFA